MRLRSAPIGLLVLVVLGCEQEQNLGETSRDAPIKQLKVTPHFAAPSTSALEQAAAPLNTIDGEWKPELIEGKNDYFLRQGYKGAVWLLFEQHGHATPRVTGIPKWIRKNERNWSPRASKHPKLRIDLERSALHPVCLNADDPGTFGLSRWRLEVHSDRILRGSFKKEFCNQPPNAFSQAMSGCDPGGSHCESVTKSQNFAAGTLTTRSMGQFCMHASEQYTVLRAADGGTLTFASTRDVYAFEHDIDRDQNPDLFVASYDNCSGWLRLLRVEADSAANKG